MKMKEEKSIDTGIYLYEGNFQNDTVKNINDHDARITALEEQMAVIMKAFKDANKQNQTLLELSPMADLFSNYQTIGGEKYGG